MRKQRTQHQAAKERRTVHGQQDDSTLPTPLPKEEERPLVVVKSTFTFPDGTEIADYHITKIPESMTYEQYRQEYFEYCRPDYPEAQLSIEFYDIDDKPTDGALPDGMTFRSAWMFEAF